MLAEDGTVVDLVDGLAAIIGKIPVGYVYVDGLEVGDIGDATLKDRRILGEEGFLSILVAVDLEAGKVVFGPEITARGFSDDPEALEPIQAELSRWSRRRSPTAPATPRRCEHLVRRTVGRWVDRSTAAVRCSCPWSSRSDCRRWSVARPRGRRQQCWSHSWPARRSGCGA